MATTRKLPDFLEKLIEEDVKDSRIAALDALAGVAQGSLIDLSDEEIAAVGMARYA